MFDAYGRNIHYLRLSVTDLCNLRCRYCMPDGVPKLAHEDILTYEEFLRLAALFAQCGIDTVRITGGEPLVRRGVEQLTAGLKAIPGIRRVALTTNGVLLAQKLPALLAAGLDSVNISLDTLHPETFRRITGKDELAAVQNGIRAALASGIPVKLNCVPQPGVNEGELESLAALAQEHPLQVRFIEMMPIGFGAGLPGLSGPVTFTSPCNFSFFQDFKEHDVKRGDTITFDFVTYSRGYVYTAARSGVFTVNGQEYATMLPLRATVSLYIAALEQNGLVGQFESDFGAPLSRRTAHEALRKLDRQLYETGVYNPTDYPFDKLFWV